MSSYIACCHCYPFLVLILFIVPTIIFKNNLSGSLLFKESSLDVVGSSTNLMSQISVKMQDGLPTDSLSPVDTKGTGCDQDPGAAS